MDPYEGFAQRYDLSFGLFGDQDPQAVEFFRQLFIQNHVRTVLDCACGTGRHLPLFRALGCEVTGSDVSESMLAQARINLAGAGLQVPLFQADSHDLPASFQQPFDAIACLGAIGFMKGDADFLRAFLSMRQALRSGGLLILTTIPTDWQWKEKPRFLLTANSPDFTRIFAIDYLANKARYNILDVFHTEKMSDLQVWSTELTPLLIDDQNRLLKASGFQKVEFFGALDFSPYDKDSSSSLITVAYK